MFLRLVLVQGTEPRRAIHGKEKALFIQLVYLLAILKATGTTSAANFHDLL